MRINTNGEKDYRTELYEHTAERFGVGTKSGGTDAACEFSNQMLHNLERAADYEAMTEDSPECFRPRTSLSSIASSPPSRSTDTKQSHGTSGL